MCAWVVWLGFTLDAAGEGVVQGDLGSYLPVRAFVYPMGCVYLIMRDVLLMSVGVGIA